MFQNSPPYKPQKPDKEQLIQELLPQPIRVQIVDLHTVTISISVKKSMHAANQANSDWGKTDDLAQASLVSWM